MNSIETRASFHGHSTYSDGLSSVNPLCQEAIRLGFSYFGISDHDTTAGVRDLVDSVNRINDSAGCISLFPVQAIEISTNQGDVVIAHPSSVYNHKFAEWGNEWGYKRAKHDLASTIDLAINEFSAIAVIVHPAETFLNSASLETIYHLPNVLSQETLRNVGLEVHNSSCRLTPKRTILREIQVDVAAKKLKLARFGLSDFHHVSQLQDQFTIVESSEVSAENLLLAIQNRHIRPTEPKPISPISWALHVMIFSLSTSLHPFRTPKYGHYPNF